MLTLRRAVRRHVDRRLAAPDARVLHQFPSRRAGQAGILSAWVGTLLVMLVTALVAVPLGVAAGIYLEEYAPQELDHRHHRDQHHQPGRRAVDHLRPAGLGLFVYTFGLGQSILSAGLTLALLILPMVIVATREAIRAIPQMIREAAYACGATKWQTVQRPHPALSMPGILTGVIIGLSRAIGETAPIITIGALTFIAFLPPAPFTGDRAVPQLRVAEVAVHGDADPDLQLDLAPGAAFHANAAAAGVVLVLMTLAMNAPGHLAALPPAQEHQVVTTHRTDDRDRIHCHAVDLTLPGRRRRSRPRSRDLNFHYGDFHALKDIIMPIYENKVTALIGPSAAASRRCCAASTACTTSIPATATRARSSCIPTTPTSSTRASTRSRCACASAWCSRSRTRSPSRSSRTSPTACGCAASSQRTLLEDKVEEALHGRGAVGRGQGPAERAGRRTCPAASSSACASPARWRPTRRCMLFDEPTSALDPIATASIEELITELKNEGDDPHRHPQHAAGGARLRLHRVHVPGRADRVRRHRRDLHQARSARKPRTTSPAASADARPEPEHA